jgi:peptidoglycan/LPS O-acetylase OafA/YrhL
MSAPKAPYYPYIDGLRAVSVLSVMLYHLHAAWLPGGFAGVDLFFVISGYVVGASLLQSEAGTLWRFSVAFYARRFLRILPALLLCLTCAVLASNLFIPQAWLSDSNRKTAMAAFFGYSNLLLAARQDSYYSPRADFNPFIHTWSLGVEEQFYLIIPPLAWAWLRLRGARRTAVTGVIAALGAASLLNAWRLGQSDANAAFYSVLSRFWELDVGALLSLALLNRPRPLEGLPTAARHAAQFVSAAAIAAAMVLVELSRFPYPWALLPVLGAALLLVSLKGESASHPVMRALEHPLFVRIGRLSYSLYLWHWPVYSLMRWTTGLQSAMQYAAAVVLTFALAGLSFVAVEQPLRESRRLRAAPRCLVVAGGVLTTLVLAGLAQTMFKHQPDISLSVTRDAAQWQPSGYPLPEDARHCAVHTDMKGAVHGQWWEFTSPDCALASPGSPHLFVMGDSHAGAYLGMIKQTVNEQGRAATLYTQGGCPYLNLITPDSENPPDCLDFVQQSSADILRRAHPGDVLFLPSLRLRRFGDQWDHLPVPGSLDQMNAPTLQVDRARAQAEGIRLMQGFVQAGLTVILEAPKPIFRAPPFRCSDWFNHMNPICEGGLSMGREELLRYREPVVQSLLTIAASSLQIRVWDPFATLCPEGDRCPSLRDGKPLFFDGDHLSGVSNQSLTASFARCQSAAALCEAPVRARQ